MPREYKTTSGPASPNPASFGSSEINIQAPRFVAQTAVAQPENQFEALQKILGLATNVFSQFQTMERTEIENKISYNKAVEAYNDRKIAEQERGEARTRREEQEAATVYSAEQRLRLAKAKTPQEAAEIEAEILRTASGTDTTSMKLAKAQIAESAEAEARQMDAAIRQQESEARQAKQEAKQKEMDGYRATETTLRARIESAVEAGSMEQLSALRNGFIKNYDDAATPGERELFQGLRALANAEMEKLDSRLDQENTKRQNSLTQEAYDAWSNAGQGHVDGLKTQVLTLYKELEGTSDSDLRSALIDQLRDKILDSNPALANTVLTGSDEENKAASAALNRLIDPVVDTLVRKRFDENQAVTFRTTRGAYVSRATTDVNVFDAILLDNTLTDSQKSIVYRDSAIQYVNAPESNVDKLNRAMNLVTGRTNPDIVNAANGAAKQVLTEISNGLALQRKAIIQSTPSGGELGPSGWNTRFNTRDELIEHVLQTSFGIDRQEFEGSPSLQAMIGPLVVSLSEQYDRDSQAAESWRAREDRKFRAANPTTKSKMKVDDAWPSSEMAMMIADGSYVSASPAQLRQVMQSSLTGFADSAVPSSLAAIVIDGADNPKNFNMVKAFWNIQTTAADPTARNRMLENEKYRESFAIGMALDYLTANPENPDDYIQDSIAALASNLKAYKNPSSDSAEAQTIKKNVTETASALASGAGLDTGWFDVTGVGIKTAIDTMDPVDRLILHAFAVPAACMPGEGNQAQLLTKMMSANGFRMYPLPNRGETKFQLIQNIPGNGAEGPGTGTTPLPEPAEMATPKWNKYLDSKKPAIAAALSNRKQLDAAPGSKVIFDPKKLGNVEIVANQQSLLDGYATVRVWETNRWVNVSEVRVTKEDFDAFKMPVFTPQNPVEYGKPKI